MHFTRGPIYRFPEDPRPHWYAPLLRWLTKLRDPTWEPPQEPVMVCTDIDLKTKTVTYAIRRT